MTNERQKQTYYGALNLATGSFWLEGYEKGNSESTLAFLQSLQAQHPGCRIAVIWDRASHHRSGAVKDYLALVNQDLEESKWQLSCLGFAPNDPQQNPVEDVWLQAKRLIREFYHLCKSFRAVRWLFEIATHYQIFRFPKVLMYGSFSQIT
jgi:transposase